MSSPQSLDINATRYLYKPNVETTKYFVNFGGSHIAEQVAQNTSDINTTRYLYKPNVETAKILYKFWWFRYY